MIKDIEGFEGLYQITSDGKVYSLVSNKYLKPKIDRYGYYAISLMKHKKLYYRTIHRLVASAFLEKKDGCNIVNHLDKLNNDYSNLEWTTYYGVNSKTIYNWIKKGGDAYAIC